ncbi:MAG TPA: tRNA lysidine(34) synthetase TilS [Candidatus Limnocylindria bacterium]
MVGGSNPPSATNPSPLSALADAVAHGADALRIPADIPLVMAVSGGPDSTALLHGAALLAPSRGWRLTVAHIDHGLREGSSTEADAVAGMTAALHVPCVVERADVRALARDEHRSLEDAGRQARYRFLERVAAGIGAEALIATAHTADDAAETILLRLVRGSGLRGVRGIPGRRGRVVRPLLHARRADLRRALDDAGIAYLTDPSNADPAAADRNRLRAEVLPALERLNPAVVEALTRFGRLAADDDDLLEAMAAAELARRRDGEAVDWHDPPTRAIGRRVLRQAIGGPAPSMERIEALLDAAEGPRGNLRIQLPGGREATVRERRIRLSR